jgi:hypothetical protein
MASRQEAPAHFPPLIAKYQLAIRGYMGQKLKDSYSAVYRFGTPRKGMLSEGLFGGGKKHLGWIVPTWINAKNGFGGYAGEQAYVMFFFDDKVTDATAAFEYGLVKSLP